MQQLLPFLEHKRHIIWDWNGTLLDDLETSVLALERGHQLIKTSGIDPAATIMIGDTNHDIDVAKQLGIDVVIYADGHQSTEQFSQYDVPILTRQS